MTYVVDEGETRTVTGEDTNGPAYIDGTLNISGTLNLGPPPLTRVSSFQIDESRTDDFTVSGRTER